MGTQKLLSVNTEGKGHGTDCCHLRGHNPGCCSTWVNRIHKCDTIGKFFVVSVACNLGVYSTAFY